MSPREVPFILRKSIDIRSLSSLVKTTPAKILLGAKKRKEKENKIERAWVDIVTMKRLCRSAHQSAVQHTVVFQSQCYTLLFFFFVVALSVYINIPFCLIVVLK